MQNAEQARTAIASMVFAPEGERGCGITSRAGRWGLDSRADYLQRGRDRVLRCLQLEDMAALQSADQIIALPGIGAVFIGMGDLTLSTGRPGDGIPVGTAVGDAKAARDAQSRGFAFVMVSNDASIFGRAAADLRRKAQG